MLASLSVSHHHHFQYYTMTGKTVSLENYLNRVPTDFEQVLTQLLEYEQITYAAQEIQNSIKYVSKSAQNTAQNTIILTKSIFEEIMVKINSLTTTGQVVAGSTAITLISTLVYFAMKSKNKKNSESAKILETEREKNEIITKETYSAFQGLDWYSGFRNVVPVSKFGHFLRFLE